MIIFEKCIFLPGKRCTPESVHILIPKSRVLTLAYFSVYYAKEAGVF